MKENTITITADKKLVEIFRMLANRIDQLHETIREQKELPQIAVNVPCPECKPPTTSREPIVLCPRCRCTIGIAKRPSPRSGKRMYYWLACYKCGWVSRVHLSKDSLFSDERGK